MQNKTLHIISFDNPFPPNYGGVIDVFYKIKALHDLGVKIYLHCFVSEIPIHFDELKAITHEVYFYKSSVNILLFLSKTPFSVISRDNKALIENLKSIKAPILFESLKTTFLVRNEHLKDYKKILRLHNIEQDYFDGISKSETLFSKKLGFYFESIKYKFYESVLQYFDKVISLSKYENEYVNEKFNNSIYIPVFHGNDRVVLLEGKGEYALYHGDLKSADNREVVRFLISVFKSIPDYRLVIASSSNKKLVKKLIGNQRNVEFVKFNDLNQLKLLFSNAHINISWSFQKSGTKLKLINSLFNSRFSVINENVIDDNQIVNLCELVHDETQLIQKIKELKEKEFDNYSKRQKVLGSYLNDRKNAELMMQLF